MALKTAKFCLTLRHFDRKPIWRTVQLSPKFSGEKFRDKNSTNGIMWGITAQGEQKNI